MATASLELTGISKRYPGRSGAQSRQLRMPAWRNPCRAWRKRLRQEHAARHRQRGDASRMKAGDDHGRGADQRRSAARAPARASRPSIRTIRWSANSPSPRTCFSAQSTGRLRIGGKRAWAAALLAPYDLDISPDAFVGNLNPAQRQFLEIVKALAANPKVLLLDEPTSTLDFSGVEKLSGIVEQIAAAGAAVVYVSHRLPEILALADRVTILRDGEGQGTYDVNGNLSENDLIALMVGRPIESGYPARRGVTGQRPSSYRPSGFSGPRFRRCRSAGPPRRNPRLRRRRRQRPARGDARARRPRRVRAATSCVEGKRVKIAAGGRAMRSPPAFFRSAPTAPPNRSFRRSACART